MIVLGIETSCDETAIAIARAPDGDGDGRILAERIWSQIDEHRPYLGVTPEIAARAHLARLPLLARDCLDRAGLTPGECDAVAATAGPGLIGGLMTGLALAKGICLGTGKRLVAVNHLEGHVLSPRLAGRLAFPYLLLLASGGHCQLVAALGVGRYDVLGETRDDAAGEALDKAARIIGLGYPGGPAIEAAARDGDPGRFPLPRPLAGREGADMSFSGLKTALARLVPEQTELTDRTRADLAASFQQAVLDVLVGRTRNALGLFRARHGPPTALAVAGGVAANGRVRQELEALARDRDCAFVAPPRTLCTDNAAMIAWAGIERLRLGIASPLDAPARARWPLSTLAGQGICP